jgi:hypothetical protein
MEGFFEGALVEGFEAPVAEMPNHPTDRHVAAVAVKADAKVIVTANLKGFQAPAPRPHAAGPRGFFARALGWTRVDSAGHPGGAVSRLGQSAGAYVRAPGCLGRIRSRVRAECAAAPGIEQSPPPASLEGSSHPPAAPVVRPLPGAGGYRRGPGGRNSRPSVDGSHGGSSLYMRKPPYRLSPSGVATVHRMSTNKDETRPPGRRPPR